MVGGAARYAKTRRRMGPTQTCRARQHPDSMLEYAAAVFRFLLSPAANCGRRVPIEWGHGAFDLLLVLLEADGSLVTKEEPHKPCVARHRWSAEENL